MATVDSLKSLLIEQVKDLYDAEKRLTKAIPKLAKASSNEALEAALTEHLAETREHVSRLEQVFELLDERAKGKPCKAMQGLIEEGDEHAKEDYDDDDLRDAMIIGSAQRVEHYEIAGYGTAIAHARLLELTEIAESVVNLQAAEDDEDAEIVEEAPVRSRRPRAARPVAADRPRRKPASGRARR